MCEMLRMIRMILLSLSSWLNNLSALLELPGSEVEGTTIGTNFSNSSSISKNTATSIFKEDRSNTYVPKYRVFNLKVECQLSREYFTSDAIYNGSVGMTLYYYMCRSWQDCCRRGENRSGPSVSVESVDSECWCLNNAIFYAFIMRLTVEECVFILESYLKTMS